MKRERILIGVKMQRLTELIRELAEPISRDEKIETIVRRAADRAGISYNRAFNLFYASRVKWTTQEEAEAVIKAVDERRRKAARNELHELKIRIAAMESRLNQIDADFHSEAIDALRPFFRPAR